MSLDQIKIIEENDSVISLVSNIEHPIFVIDSNIHKLYNDQFLFIEEAGYPCWVSAPGEDTKNFQELERCLNYFLDRSITRSSHLIAVGGGATSDFGGLVASLLLRGIKWSVIPTTLLAMVDGSIGGKVAINSNMGKNLIGGFNMPEAVYMDFNYLDTLSPVEMNSGMGEVLKYSFLSKTIKQMVLKGNHIHEIICECASFKNKIVKEDPFERGPRIQFNLGHTLGHAIEKAYEIPHGTAVIMGIGLIHKIYPYPNFEKDYYDLCSALGIDMGEKSYDYEFKKLKQYIKNDKKRVSSNEVELVLVKEIGKYYTEKVALEDLEKGLEGVL